MRAVRFVIPKTGGNSFRVQTDRQPYFYDTIHYHPEHQISVILKGEGTGFIGNHVERFAPGDVYLIGKNIPHVFKCDSIYYEEDSKLEAHGLSVYFKDETFGPQFFWIPEMAHIKRLLEQASMGIKIRGEDRERIIRFLKETRNQDAFGRFQSLLSILDTFAKSENIKILSTIKYTTPSKDSEHERINVVFHYLSDHFCDEISLSRIASVASLTPNAFCRYFKQRTGKTHVEFLNGMRVEKAGKLIAGSQETLGNIAFQSGFKSISYFNRQFKKIMGVTPLEYRKKYGH